MIKFRSLIVLIFLSGLIPILSFGQDNNVASAYSELQAGNLLRAKEYINKAILHKRTKDQARTWYYRGMIYQNMTFTLNNSEYDSIPNKALTAAKSFQKARTLDISRYESKDLESRYRESAELLFQEGVSFYNESQYQQSAEYFSTCVEIKEEFGITDSLAIYNMALSYDFLENFDQAEQAYRKCIDIDYHPVIAYQGIILIHQKQGDFSTASNVVNEALSKFPDNSDLMIVKIDMLLRTGDNDEALELINSVIAERGGNSTLYYVRGSLYGALGQAEASEADYLKAIEINPDYFEAHYNLGAHYFNLAVDKNNEGIDLEDQEEYGKLKRQADELFTKAMTALEAAHELNPSERSTMQSLLQIYARLNLMDKYTKVKAKLNEN